MIIAKRPFHSLPGVSIKRLPAPALRLDRKPKSGLFLGKDTKESVHALRIPYLCYVLDGEIDIRLAIPARHGKSRGIANYYDILSLSTGSLLLIPPGTFFPQRGRLWERMPSLLRNYRLFWMHIFAAGVLCHTSSIQNGVHMGEGYDIFVPDVKLAVATDLLQDELQRAHKDSYEPSRNAFLLMLYRIQRHLAQNPEDKGELPPTLMLHAAPSTNSDIIERACRYIQSHRDKSFAVKDVADHVYISPSHLSKLFRTTLNTTIKKYTLDRRMEAARLLLSSTEIPIQEIARFCGYMQAPQFNKVFKEIHHLTPKQFRQRITKGQSER